MQTNNWAWLPAYATGLVNQPSPPVRILMAENRILRSHLPGNVRLSNPERRTLAEIGKRFGRKALAQVACVAKRDTILAWYRRLIAQKFDGSRHRSLGIESSERGSVDCVGLVDLVCKSEACHPEELTELPVV